MRRILAASLVLLATALVAPGQKPPPPPPVVATTEARPPEEERKAFHLPPGFEIQLVAAERDIQKPMNLAFDDRGRLWVTGSVEYPDPAKGQGRDTVKVLDEIGEDGKARKITTFVDGLNIPIGLLPTSQGVIVYNIPNISRFVDTDGDGKADRRDVLYESIGFDDTHGNTNSFTLGFDGWVYACHGFRNTSVLQGADGNVVRMQSGNTYRMKTDGSRVEHFTFGQVNPFGLTFDPFGNLYSSDCHTKPLYQLLRGSFYPSFEKTHDGLGFGPEMMTHDHESTGIAGACYYAADHFPPEYRDTMFCANVVTGRINHDRVEHHGSTVRAVKLPDFLVSDDPWFHPVDIKLGPDGALYVADFYNRIIGHYEVPLDHPGRDRYRGRIWRIVYRGEGGKRSPFSPCRDFRKAGLADLVQALGDPNLTVRLMATNQLAERNGVETVRAVRTVFAPGTNPYQRAHAIWVLERCSALDDATLKAACQDSEAIVRVHAQRILAERASWKDEHRELALAGLRDVHPNVQRNAADALGRHPDVVNLRPLLDLRHTVPADDPALLHVVRMALRDQLRSPGMWARLPGSTWTDADFRAVADVALGAPGVESAAFIMQHLQKRSEAGDLLFRSVRHVARFGNPEIDRSLLAFIQTDRGPDVMVQAALFRSMAQGLQERGAGLDNTARNAALTLARKLIASKKDVQVQLAIDLTTFLRFDAMQDDLIQVGAGRGLPDPIRASALTALVDLTGPRHVEVFATILTDTGESIGVREHAARMLARMNQPVATDHLLTVLPVAPARLQVVIAGELANNKAGAERLLEAIGKGKASARLLQERLVTVRLGDGKVPNAKERIAKLTEGLPAADQKLQELMNARRGGYLKSKPDAVLGAKVFEQRCAVCHQIAGKGAKIGPQLDGIGIRGLDRLLEDTLDPNRNVDGAFRQTTITLTNGQVVLGLALREEGEVVVLADSQGKEVRVPKKTIEEREVSQLSPMPGNLADDIPEADFYHLLAYLLSQQAPPK